MARTRTQRAVAKVQKMDESQKAALTSIVTDSYALLDNTELLQERIAELEFALEDVGWQRLGTVEREFSRAAIRILSRMSRLHWLKNPLIRRAQLVLRFYVFGQGYTINCGDPQINAAIQAFFDDTWNKKVLTSQITMADRDRDLWLDGNLVFALFTNPITGRVQVRSIPADEIEEIVHNPEDRLQPRLYKRIWTRFAFDQNAGALVGEGRTDWYPSIEWARDAPALERQATFGGNPVHWDTPLYHVKAGVVGDMRFGVPEAYPALDWARAVKENLEDYATIARALARYAIMVTTRGGKSGVSALKTKLGTTLAQVSGQTAESNPPPATGAAFLTAEGPDGQPVAKVEPFRSAGAQPSSDDGRALRLMVSAATGIPETILMGDADVGNLATAKTLDRPTELQVAERQQMWGQIVRDLCAFVVRASADAIRPVTPVTGIVWERNPDDGREMMVVAEPERDVTVDLSWPSILQDDEASRVTALIGAFTLDGKKLVDGMPEKVFVRLLFDAVGVPDVDEVLTRMYPDGIDSALTFPEPQQFGLPPAGDPNNPNAPQRPNPADQGAHEAMLHLVRTMLTAQDESKTRQAIDALKQTVERALAGPNGTAGGHGAV